MATLLDDLVSDVEAGIRVLRDRDGLAISNEQLLERARNIVTGLVGGYDIAVDAEIGFVHTHSPPDAGIASVVRRQVLDQHQVLRGKLWHLLRITTETLQGTRNDEAGLRMLVLDLRERFRRHLAFEERSLAPLLSASDCWGPQRVEALLAEHERQRGDLEALIEGMAEGWDAGRLAFAARSLTTDLLLDMDEEERGCLAAELLRDDVVSVDQATD
jgi:hypothetical protein